MGLEELGANQSFRSSSNPIAAEPLQQASIFAPLSQILPHSEVARDIIEDRESLRKPTFGRGFGSEQGER